MPGCRREQSDSDQWWRQREKGRECGACDGVDGVTFDFFLSSSSSSFWMFECGMFIQVTSVFTLDVGLMQTDAHTRRHARTQTGESIRVNNLLCVFDIPVFSIRLRGGADGRKIIANEINTMSSSRLDGMRCMHAAHCDQTFHWWITAGRCISALVELGRFSSNIQIPNESAQQQKSRKRNK